MFKVFVFFFIFLLLGFGHNLRAQNTFLSGLKSPIIFKGDERTAYRDPAVLYHNHKIYLFFTLVKSENEEEKKDGSTRIRTAVPGFRVRYANHYIIEPIHFILTNKYYSQRTKNKKLF